MLAVEDLMMLRWQRLSSGRVLFSSMAVLPRRAQVREKGRLLTSRPELAGSRRALNALCVAERSLTSVGMSAQPGPVVQQVVERQANRARAVEPKLLLKSRVRAIRSWRCLPSCGCCHRRTGFWTWSLLDRRGRLTNPVGLVPPSVETSSIWDGRCDATSWRPVTSAHHVLAGGGPLSLANHRPLQPAPSI